MVRTPFPATLRALLGTLAATSLLVLAGGFVLYRSRSDSLLQVELRQLASVAESRTRLVANWRRERLGDGRAAAAVFGHAPLVGVELEGSERQHVLDHLSQLCRSYGYRRAQVFDAGGRLLLAADGGGVTRPEPLSHELLAAILAEPTGALVAAASGGESGRFVVLARPGARTEEPHSIVALTVDAETALFPALAHWPVASRSATSFLAERTPGGYRALLTPRGDRPRPSLLGTVDDPLARRSWNAELGVRAMTGSGGRPVFVVVRPIPETAWLLAAQIDRDEVGETFAVAAARIAVGCLLLLVALWSSAFVFWNRARVRAAASAREHSEALRAVVDYAPDAIVLFDTEGRVLEVNRAMVRLVGRERGDLIGRSLASLFAPASLRETPLRMDELSDGQHVVSERPIVTADGREVVVELSAGRLPDGRLIAFARDTAERRALERRMRLLSRALEESPAPALIADLDGEIEYVNRRYSEVTGYAREEIIGCRPRFLDAESSSADAAVLASVLSGNEWTGELVDRRKNGEIFFWRLHVHPIPDESGRLAHLLAVGEDVSERRRQSERYRLARRMVRMGVYEWDFQRRELWWSEECYELYGVEPKSFRPSADGILTLVHPEDRSQVERAFQRAVDGGPPFDLEFRIRPGGQGERRVRSVAALLRDDAGVPLAAIGVVLDVSDQRAAERALEETREQLFHAQKMEALGRLAGGIAHDFNNLLGIILGYAELLAEVAPPDSEPRRQIEEVRRAAERAAELTRQLLAIGRRQTLELRAVELRPLLEETEKLLRRVMPESIELSVEIAAGLETVQADPTNLLQVVLNLALNARDAMPGGGRLGLAVCPVELDAEAAALADVEPGAYVRLELADDGAGMSSEALERAFEPFFTTKSAHGASGLGLATVYGIVRQLGGNVELRSAVGQGTTAEVLLPRGSATGRAQAAAQAASEERKASRVLVVEDVAPLGQMIQRMLAAGGGDVRVVETPDQALELASRPGFAVDLLLTDLVLPGMDGRELARRLRERLPGLKVIVMSGYSELLAEASGPADLGADAILSKPFTRGRLEEVVAAVLVGRERSGADS